jgi:CheY-like chemotaxis protein
MNGNMGMIHLAMLRSKEPAVKEYLELADESAAHLLGLINDILDLAKIEAGKIAVLNEPFSIRGELAYTVEPYIIAAGKKGLALHCKIDENLPDRVVGDRGRLRQVLSNLVDNSLKFTESGGIDIAVETIGQNTNRAVSCRFSVRDTGIGIPAHKLLEVFESFEQAHVSSLAKYGGTGLGLTISKRLVELMGGEIKAESREYAGSTFSFTLELGLAAPAAETDETPSCNRYLGRPLHILVAEDNQVNRIYIRAILAESGHSVEMAGTGREAIEKLAQGRFDAVLMDIRMPEMDGDEAVRIIRNDPPECVNPNIPIIALTAYALEEEIDRYMQSGFDAYLTKPVGIEELKKALLKIPGGHKTSSHGTS